MFLSVLQDFFNSLALSLIYGRHGRVDWKYGLYYGVLGAAAACTLALVLSGYIEQHEEMLESYMFFVPLVLGVGFTIKGFMVLQRRKKSEGLTWKQSIMLKSNATATNKVAASTSPSTSAVLAGAAEKLSQLDDAGALIVLPAIETQHPPVVSIPPTPGSETPGADEENVAELDADDVPMISPDEFADLRYSDGSFKERILHFASRFASKEDILAKRMTRKTTRIVIMGLFTFIMACISGILFFGGGMAFALATASLFRINVRTATGTACFMCVVIMFALLLTFIRYGAVVLYVFQVLTCAYRDTDGTIRTMDTALYACIIVPMGIFGSLLGAKLSMKISDVAIFFFISLVLFVIGILITVQRFSE